MRVQSNIKNRKNKTIIILVVAIIALISIVSIYTAYARSQSLWPFVNTSSQNSQEPANSEDTNPSTPSTNNTDPTYSGEKNNTGDINSGNGQSSTPSNPDSATNRAKVQVGISSAGRQDSNVEVRAFISGAIEGNGTCTAIFTHNGRVIQATSKAFIDASTSQCEPIVVDGSRFSAEVWSLIVKYESSSHSGESAPLEVSL
jgi:cytoskeletal protein RodZ